MSDEASTPPPEATERPTGSKRPIDLPLRKAMPFPLLITFGLLGVSALVAAIVLLIRPTVLAPTPVSERRPAPTEDVSHAAGRVVPAPTPSSSPSLPPPCPTFEATRLVMSGDGVSRVTEGLRRLCRLSDGGIGQEFQTALEGLGQATIRFAQFELSGTESTLEPATSTIWLNIRFARRDTSIDEMLPPLIHEGFHLGSGDPFPDAESEVLARRAELDACKQLIPRDEWPRWCRDAEAIVSLPLEDAVKALADAGFAEP